MATYVQWGGLAGVTGCAVVWWLRAPILDTLSIQQWRGIALVVAVAVGAGGVALTNAWFRINSAVTIGLVVGAAWVEFSIPSDVRVSLIDSVAAAVSNYGVDFIGPLVVAIAVGAFLARSVLGQALRDKGRARDG